MFESWLKVFIFNHWLKIEVTVFKNSTTGIKYKPKLSDFFMGNDSYFNLKKQINSIGLSSSKVTDKFRTSSFMK